MIISLLLLLSLSTLAIGTQLQTNCVGLNQAYTGTSCYVLHISTSVYSKAKISCKDYLGFSGHLIFIQDASEKATLHELLKSNNITSAFTGYEQTNTTGARNASWYYANIDGTYTPASYIPWGWNGSRWEPTGSTSATRAVYSTSENGTKDVAGESTAYPFVCEYEEALMQTVTTLEASCAAINSTKYSLFANGTCYSMSTSTVLYDTAKLSCNDVPGINGHLIHPRNYAQIAIIQNYITVAGSGTQYAWIGLEQPNISSPDSVGWYYSTPQDTNELATFLPWWPPNPNGGTQQNVLRYEFVSSIDLGFSDWTNSDYFRGICEYESTRTMTGDLNTKCAALNGTNYQAYTSDGNCFVMHTEKKTFNNAQLSCRDFPGYDGHLLHLRNYSQQLIIDNLMKAAGITDAFIGLEQVNLTEADSSTDWYYVSPFSNSEKALYLPWNATSYTGGNYSNNVYYHFTAPSKVDSIWSQSNLYSYSFICHYEQSTMRTTISATESYCFNLTNAWFYNGSCLTMKGNSSGSQRNACPAAPGIASHLAHLKNTAKWVTARTLGRQACELLSSGAKNVVAYPSCYSMYTGFEQLKGCSANTCAEEPDKAWFWTTPEGYKWAADIYSTPLFATNYPNDTMGVLDYALMYDAGYQDISGTTFNSDLCEYHDPYNYTAVQASCLKSLNPSTFIGSTCYTLNRVSATYTTATSSCTEFAGGHLAFINSTTVATKLRAQLWANLGLPKNMILYTGLRQNPSSSNQWFYYNGNDQPAVNPPWAAGEPQYKIGDCTSLNQSGALFASSCTASQWFLCQYDDCSSYSAVWSAWSSCSQSCDNGIRSRELNTLGVQSSCSSTDSSGITYEYQSCSSGTSCRPANSQVTTLQTKCAALPSSYYAYSSCYFMVNVSGTQSAASTACMSQGGQLASLFGPGLTIQLGSILLQNQTVSFNGTPAMVSVQAWVGLQYNGGNLLWTFNGTQYPNFDNTSAPSDGTTCFALVANLMTTGNISAIPQLVTLDCASTLSQAICMITNNIYSSYAVTPGTKITETSPQLVSVEVDYNACGARCSEIIGCLGFNFNPSDGTCIPTKVSIRTPTSINGNQVSTIQADANFMFYDRT